MFDLTSIFQAVFLCFFVIASLRLFRPPSFIRFPYYESVYLENQCFTIEADNQYQADEKAYRFLANLQKKHDLAYEKLLDEQGIRFRKREEIIERRPIYLRDLRRQGDPDSFGSQKDPKV